MEDYVALRSISICSGIAGLDLGVSRVFPTRTVCYVEREIAAAEILVARMEEGQLDPAPIYSDLGTFDGQPWRGKVDLITAGLPCQPFSLAGKRLGEDDDRYLWPKFFRVLREVRPAMVFLENVPGILKFFRPIGEELCDLGYEIAPKLVTAAEVGAPHKRERFFCLAYRPEHGRLQGRTEPAGIEGGSDASVDGGTVEDAGSGLHREGRSTGTGETTGGRSHARPSGPSGVLGLTASSRYGAREPGQSGPVRDEARGPEPDGRRDAVAVADAGSPRRPEDTRSPSCDEEAHGRAGRDAREPDGDHEPECQSTGFPPGPNDHEAWSNLLVREPWMRPALSQAEAESLVRREFDGISLGLDRTARLRALGNAVVPPQAEYALRLILASL